jgi:Uma2 family endonuclease
MATQPIGEQSGRFVSVEEYLSTGYEPDCEYDHGVIVERNLGEFEHSFLQIILGTLFTNNMDRWGVFGLTEQRVQIAQRKFLIPDVCVLRMGSPAEDILRRAAKKAAEYRQFGIENVWVIDPHSRVAYRGTATGLERVPSGELTVPESPILVRVAELFEKLDRIRSGAGQR